MAEIMELLIFAGGAPGLAVASYTLWRLRRVEKRFREVEVQVMQKIRGILATIVTHAHRIRVLERRQ